MYLWRTSQRATRTVRIAPSIISAWRRLHSLGVVHVAGAAVEADACVVDWLRAHLALRQDFHKVAVWVPDEGEPLHPARVRRLGELAPQLRKARAGRVHVGHRDAEVAETTAHLLTVGRADSVGVPSVVYATILRLTPVVPRELDAAWRPHARRPLLLGRPWDVGGLGRRHKVHVEAVLRKLAMHDEPKAEDVAVEVKRRHRAFHPDHRLLHDIPFGLCRPWAVHILADVGRGGGRTQDLR
mmetsp:Transcript_34272/g.58682  ORF Transcript_34272/g.58682 Transcript_34272/m.58682 type:complete len:241 (+) Transcript_34272:317-1039(+)